MSEIPNKAKMFIVAVMLVAAAVTVYAIGTRLPAETKEFLVLAALALIAARLKLTLPGFESNMSMNLPFMLLAISELSLAEAIAVGAMSTFVQTLPRSGQTVKPAQAVFNVCNIVNAIAIASVVGGRTMHFATLNKPFLIASAALAFFLADTLPVAAIISMTSPTKLIENWSEMALMTFPYFVLSAGLACIVAMGFQAIGWLAGGYRYTRGDASGVSLLPVLLSQCASPGRHHSASSQGSRSRSRLRGFAGENDASAKFSGDALQARSTAGGNQPPRRAKGKTEVNGASFSTLRIFLPAFPA